MSRTFKYSLTLFVLIFFGFYNTFSQAGTIILENNTKLTLEINSGTQLIGYAMPESKFSISVSDGYHTLRIKSINLGSDGEKYPTIFKSISIDNSAKIRSIFINDKDFGKSIISGPGCDPSMGGKYVNLLRRIQVTDDVNHYGKCKDSGKWNGTKYKGYDNLPKGYWVYMYPDWYIWGGVKTAASKPAEPKTTSGCDTTMGGKYSSPIRTVKVAEDKDQYGECHDWGLWKGTTYKGHKNLPEGYWVYKYPNWIIYGTKN